LLAFLALSMLLLTAIPAGVWKARTTDAVYRGFDKNLLATTGSVALTSNTVTMTPGLESPSAVTLFTTLRQTLEASIDVTVMSLGPDAPSLKIGLWSPWTGSGYFVAFGPSPADQLETETINGGSAGVALQGGTESQVQLVGTYLVGRTYKLTFNLDRRVHLIEVKIATNGGLNLTRTFNSAPMFDRVHVSLTASSLSGSSPITVALTDYTLTLPHERLWASSIDDPVARILIVGLAVGGLAAIALAVIDIVAAPVPHRLIIPTPDGRWIRMGALVLVYLVGNAALFPVAAHPFDFANELLYAHVARVYGPAQLYFLPDVSSLASTSDGIPWLEAGFPYEPVIAYLFSGLGWIASLTESLTREPYPAAAAAVIKTGNVCFAIADAALIYLILGKLSVPTKWRQTAAAIFLLSPATIMSTSIWGQTHVISIFFILLAILGAERRMPVIAWASLAAACLTRPQMSVFGLLLAVAFLKKFSVVENLRGVSWGVIITFVALVPITLLTDPSLPVDVLLNNLRVQELGTSDLAAPGTVSLGAYTVWPLVTYAFHGASGLDRAFTPSSLNLVGALTYLRASQILTIGVLLIITTVLALRRRATFEQGGYLPLVTVGVLSFLMLQTAVVPTHFLLGLPMILLCMRWMGPLPYLFAAAAWTLSAFVAMYGELGLAVSAKSYPLFAAERNPVTAFFESLYGWDRFITVAIVANICAVIWMAFLSVRAHGAPSLRYVPADSASD
jgi:hypothetical protein